MSVKLLQVNFNFETPARQLVQAVTPTAEAYAVIPGLLWKLWLINNETGEAGELYLFEDDASLQAFLQSPLAPKLDQSKENSIKQFSIIAAPSRVTRGPI